MPRYRCEDPEFLALYYRCVRHAWRLEDVLEREIEFDFSRPFMPDHVTPAAALSGSDAVVQLTLSHLRGYQYINIIVAIEDLIVDFLWRLIGRNRYELATATQQALINFAAEEMKHTIMFQSLNEAYHRSDPLPATTVARTPAIGRLSTRFDDLAILLFVLHGEVMTYINYANSVGRGPTGTDALFASVLRYHWIEESGHVALDELLLAQMARSYDEARRVKAVEQYCDLVDFLTGAVTRLAQFDIERLTRNPATKEAVLDARGAIWTQQKQFYLQSYVLDVMRAPRFRRAIATLTESALDIVDRKVAFVEEIMRGAAVVQGQPA